MGCPLCEVFRRKYPLVKDEDDGELIHIIERHEDGRPLHTSSPISCAFEGSEEFSSTNWCCETIALLRSVFWTERIYPIWNNDSNVGVIPIPVTDDPEEESGIQQGFLVMSWYKSRGRTGQAVIMNDDDEPRKLNLKTAQFIIKEMRLK